MLDGEGIHNHQQARLCLCKFCLPSAERINNSFQIIYNRKCLFKSRVRLALLVCSVYRICCDARHITNLLKTATSDISALWLMPQISGDARPVNFILISKRTHFMGPAAGFLLGKMHHHLNIPRNHFIIPRILFSHM